MLDTCYAEAVYLLRLSSSSSMRTLIDDSSPVGTIASSSRLVAPVYVHHFQIFFWCVLPCPLGSSNVPLAIFRSPFYVQAS